MRLQAKEEQTHALKFFDYINEQGGRVILQAIDAPPTEWESPIQAFEVTLTHEQKVTGLINSLVDLAKSENDYATDVFLQWFVTEQVEEEDSANDVIQQIKMVGEAEGGLFMLDRELGQRTFTAPAEE